MGYIVFSKTGAEIDLHIGEPSPADLAQLDWRLTGRLRHGELEREKGNVADEFAYHPPGVHVLNVHCHCHHTASLHSR